MVERKTEAERWRGRLIGTRWMENRGVALLREGKKPSDKVDVYTYKEREVQGW